MPKNTTIPFVCQQCGAVRSKWAGRCDLCGAWNSFVEQPTAAGSTVVATSKGTPLSPLGMSEIKPGDHHGRLGTGLGDVDSVLGGGIVAASVILLAGQPGIGKSTLLMQIAQNLSAKVPVLYVSGEESVAQIKTRADRLSTAPQATLHLAASTSADDIAATIRSSTYKAVIVDSMQTLTMADIASAAGSVSQITNAANLLTQAAKATNTALIIVGHVTKEGNIAGPKILEHMVDVVINLEGDRYGGFKVLRVAKNRYGATNEVGIFEMRDKGLLPVKNPSAALLAERFTSDGSVVFATIEGNRPLLVEIQALVNKTNFGYPKRTASGFDLNRLNVLIAVLERRTKLNLSDSDIYINAVGGIKLQDPAADLAVCMAIASAARELQLDPHAVVFGEVGLGGEVRSVAHASRRVAEAKKLGFTYAIGPKTSSLSGFLRPVASMRDALITHLQKPTKRGAKEQAQN